MLAFLLYDPFISQHDGKSPRITSCTSGTLRRSSPSARRKRGAKKAIEAWLHFGKRDEHCTSCTFWKKIKMVAFGAEACVEVPFCPLKKLLQRIDKELDR